MILSFACIIKSVGSPIGSQDTITYSIAFSSSIDH